MKIVILGAGKVGQSIVENFIDEESDLVIIDEDQDKLNAISSKYDLLTIHGSATNINTLDHADLKSANLVIAVTDNDETNIIACKIANDIYNVQYKIARLRKTQYLNNQHELFNEDIFPIDYIIEPTRIMASSLYNLIKYPGVENFTYFGDNSCALFTVQSQYGGIFVGSSAQEACNQLGQLKISVVAIIRNGNIIKINEATIINARDEIVLFTEPDQVMLAVSYFQRPLNKPKKIMLAGGSKINYYLASMLSKSASVKVIESDISKANNLANDMANILVIEGDCTDENLLFDERIDKTDLFVAATDQDNINVLTGVLAKRLGSKRVITLLSKSSNRSLIHNEEIDIIYSGKNDIATELRSKAKISNYTKIYKHPNNTFQFAEFDVFTHLKVFNEKALTDLKIPQGSYIVGVITSEGYKIYSPDLNLQKTDKVVLMFTETESLELFAKQNFKSAEYV